MFLSKTLSSELALSILETSSFLILIFGTFFLELQSSIYVSTFSLTLIAIFLFRLNLLNSKPS